MEQSGLLNAILPPPKLPQNDISNIFIFKRNTPQLAAAGIKGMRIQFRLRSAWPGSNFMRQRLGCPAACGVGALPPFHFWAGFPPPTE
jgi:hypothetical protein